MVYVKQKKTIELISCIIFWGLSVVFISFSFYIRERFKLNNCSTCVCWILDAIYQTREAKFYRDIQTLRGELKIRRAAEYF